MQINDETTQKFNIVRRKKRHNLLYEKLGNINPKSVFTELKIDEYSRSKGVWSTGVLVLASVLFLITKSFSLQIVEGKANNDLAQQNTIRRELIQPYRGAILDRNGNVLVRNEPSFAFQLDIARCRDGFNNIKPTCKEDLKTLRNLLGKKYKLATDAEILKKTELGVLSFVVVSDMSKDDAIDISTKFKSNYINQTLLPQRDYLYPEAFAHVLGFVGIGDTIYPTIQGKDGIEKYYDSYLNGIAGERVYKVNSFGEISETVSEKAPVAGSDLQVSIDRNLQLLAYDLLKNKVDGKKVFGGAVVAQDPHTGNILALVSYPTYDSKKLSRGLSVKEYQELLAQNNQPFFNRAITGTYPPGSTFKMVTASAGLMEKTINDKTTIFDPGYIKVGSYIFRNWKLDGHGTVDIYTALQKSNDTFFYTVVGGHGNIKGLGIKKLHYWADKFGYGRKTGIDLFGEASGYMPDGSARTWYLGDNFISAIGQGDILATPLQVNNVTTYFANGGELYKPRLILAEGEAIPEQFDLIDTRYYEIIRKGMLMASTPGGTGYPFFDFKDKYGADAAGKTGTSEFINKFGEPDTHGWFTVFAPYKNSQIALTVFIEGGGTGSDDAAVIARKLMDEWFKNSRINRD
jgi:penicillin-binding protein 2